MKKEPCDKLYRLHLRLRMELDAEEEKTLKKYGKVKKELSRDLAVPSDITLHALHFAIQQAFGWRNSHLHRFTLDEPFTSDRTKIYRALFLWRLAGALSGCAFMV